MNFFKDTDLGRHLYLYGAGAFGAIVFFGYVMIIGTYFNGDDMYDNRPEYQCVEEE